MTRETRSKTKARQANACRPSNHVASEAGHLETAPAIRPHAPASGKQKVHEQVTREHDQGTNLGHGTADFDLDLADGGLHDATPAARQPPKGSRLGARSVARTSPPLHAGSDSVRRRKSHENALPPLSSGTSGGDNLPDAVSLPLGPTLEDTLRSWDASGTDTTAQRSSPFPTDPIDACFGFSAGRLRGRAQTPCTGGALPGSQLPARSNQGTPHLPMDEIYDATPPCRGGTRDEATTTKALPWPAPSQVADMPSSVTLTEPFLIQNESKPPANPTGQGPSRTRHDRAAKSTAGRDSSQALGQASTRQRRAGTWLPSSEAVQDPFKASKSVGGTKRKQRPKSSLPYDESTGLFMPKPAKVCEQVKAHGGSLRWSNSAPAVSQQRAAPTDGDMARKRKKITMDESPSGPCHAVKASPSAGNPSTRSAQASRRGKQARQQGKQSPSHTPPDPEPKRDVYLDAILVSTDSSYSSSPKTVPAEGIRKNGDRRGSTEERAAESMTRNDMTFLQRLCSTVKLAKMFAGIFGSGDSLAAMEDISMKMKTVRWGDVAPSADASPATSTGGTNEGKHAGRDNSTDDKASSPLNLVVRDSSPKPCRSAGEAAKPARRVARREQRQPSADGSYMLVEESNASLKILSPGWHVQALNISLCRPTRASQAEGTAKEKTVED